MKPELSVVPFKGVRPDSLGNYFVGLGLIAALSKKYPQIRGCWRNGHFVLVGDSLSTDAVKNYLLNEWQPTSYVRWWEKAYGIDSELAKKKKIGEALPRERAQQPTLSLRALDSTVVTVERPVKNPIFGNIAGKLGAKRDFSKVQSACEQFLHLMRGRSLQTDGVAEDVKKFIRDLAKSQQVRETIAGWLENTLFDEFCQDVPPIGGAGTWFVCANKTFNSGQDWSRDGEVSPWSYLLALEGALLLVGGVNRRLGSRSRPYAVFPFISEAPSPRTEKEIGLVNSEFWSPLWANPMNLSELRVLLERGLARIGIRAAKAPHDFAVAAMAAAVDVGITSFARFTLRQTTNSNFYEAIPRERVEVGQKLRYESELLEPLITKWLDWLPNDPKNAPQKKKIKFKGLRGPIEDAIVRVAARPDDAERWRQLWLLLADTQGKIDRNQNLRGKSRAVPWLNDAWFEKAWPVPPAEIQIARAIASIGAGTDTPIISNIFGVTFDRYKQLVFAGEQRPQRVVWHDGGLLIVLPALLHRRLIDAKSKDELPRPPLIATRKCLPEILAAFTNKSLDYEMIGRWIPALSLVNWSRRSNPTTEADKSQSESFTMDGAYLLQALFRPLFCPFNPRLFGEKFFPPHLSPRAVTARRLLNLIRQSSWDEAIQLAQSRYLASSHNIVTTPVMGNVNGELIASALLVPLSVNEIARGLSRWLKPKKYSTSGELKDGKRKLSLGLAEV